MSIEHIVSANVVDDRCTDAAGTGAAKQSHSIWSCLQLGNRELVYLQSP